VLECNLREAQFSSGLSPFQPPSSPFPFQTLKERASFNRSARRYDLPSPAVDISRRQLIAEIGSEAGRMDAIVAIELFL